MNLAGTLSKELGLRLSQAEAVIGMIDEGNTIPFIARYRKERSGGMDDEMLRSFEERLRGLRRLEERRNSVLSSLEEQGALTDALRTKVMEAESASSLEDIYRPYRPKRRTRAMIAREQGLQALADFLLEERPSRPVEEEAKRYLDPEKGILGTADAIRGAEDILAEQISDEAGFRSFIRELSFSEGLLGSKLRDEALREEKSVYEIYFDFQEAVKSLPPHRILAINRGEAEKVLSVKLLAPEDKILDRLLSAVLRRGNRLSRPFLEESARDAYRRLIAPSIETELRNQLTERAEESAISVFGMNLKQLLLQPPLSGKVILGWDPGFRTGCKLAVIDETGRVLDTAVIYPTAPRHEIREALSLLSSLVKKYGVSLISLGNGTASRESEQIIADFIRESRLPLRYVIVNEAGASVYSASRLGAEEFPDFDPGQRSAVSMARRLQDPLSELVKIDPQSIGVGQYQHDLNQGKLSEKLRSIVEDCVNSVGVDLNTASVPLLSAVSGISRSLAKNIVSYRESHGSFAERRELLLVPRLGPRAYEQCAGFLRITGGKEPLDESAVHPESYDAARKLLSLLGLCEEDIRSGRTRELESLLSERGIRKKELMDATGLGEYSLSDILRELEKPGRDPRASRPAPLLRSDVLKLSDLKEGMILEGVVRNITDFGAFLDIGVHQDGLVHISELAERYVKHPSELLKLGQVKRVRVLSVDEKRGRISLSMKKIPS